MRKLLWVILVAGFAARATYCWRFPQWGPGGAIPDPNWYETMAESLLRQGRLLDPFGNLSAAREPAYPLLLAGLYHATGPSYRAVQALNCVLGTITLGLIFSLGAAVFGELTALAATAIAAFYPQFLYYTATLDRETFLVFLIALTLWLLLRACRTSSGKYFALAGLVAALAPLSNSALLPAVLMLALSILWMGRSQGRDYRRHAALYLAALLGLYSLWPLRNYRVFHRFILGINGGGAHMYVGMIVPNDVAGTEREKDFVANNPVCVEASRLPVERRDAVYYRAALRWMREHPFGYIRFITGSFVKLWRFYPYPRAYAYNYRLIKWAGLLSDGWIIPFGLLGAILVKRRRHPATIFFDTTLFSITFTYMLFWSIIRYRLPMMPVAILYCAYSLSLLWNKTSST